MKQTQILKAISKYAPFLLKSTQAYEMIVNFIYLCSPEIEVPFFSEDFESHFQMAGIMQKALGISVFPLPVALNTRMIP
ncbi:hypothetical protein CDL62_01085 [Alkalitalea saponilacus]|nr:hypothetical protein CDL62_01085 [Alkalitalea saponilacus]